MAKKLERRLAYYANGKIEEGKTNRKTFKTDGLVGIVALYTDGTREEEPLEAAQTRSKASEDDIDTQIAKLMFKANLQFKHDGGDTPEIKALRAQKRK